MPRKVCFQASTWSCAYLQLLRKLRKLDVLNSYILDKNLYKVLYIFPSLSLNSLIQNNTLLIQNKNYLQRISPIARHCIKANRYRLQLRSRHRKGGWWSQSPEVQKHAYSGHSTWSRKPSSKKGYRARGAQCEHRSRERILGSSLCNNHTQNLVPEGRTKEEAAAEVQCQPVRSERRRKTHSLGQRCQTQERALLENKGNCPRCNSTRRGQQKMKPVYAQAHRQPYITLSSSHFVE